MIHSYRYRTPYLLFLHLQEIEFAQRMIFSLILGGIIGFERRASERPAGIRTSVYICGYRSVQYNVVYQFYQMTYLNLLTPI
jgi:uncharacterized membrane protein YhiD involved in acid resistance